LEVIELTAYTISKPFSILAGFGIFWNHFHTRIHTQPTGFFESFEGWGEKILPPTIFTSI
jgi:hypothetical protein